MIQIEQLRALNLQIQDEDIDTFITLLNKLLIASKQTGFKKPFTVKERDLIMRIAENLGLDNPEESKINAEKEQIKSNESE
jgi:hypothetical protein